MPKKFEQDLLTRVSRKFRQRSVCLLSAKAAQAFENWRQSQPCSGKGCFHVHLKRELAERLVANGEARWLGEGMNVVAARGIPREPDKRFQQAHAMWIIGFEDKHQECQAGLVSPR
jgi:hypothetical protein